MQLNKIEIAKRQLETGIDLLFDDADFVSIHTLLFASSEVLKNLCEARGIKSVADQALDRKSVV